MQNMTAAQSEKSLRVDLNPIVPRRMLLVAIALICTSSTARAGADHHESHAHPQNMITPGYKRSVASYAIPDVSLLRANRTRINFPQEIDDGRPVVLNFIYTTCTAVCPMTSQTFAAFQEKLSTLRSGVHMLSISIDPEQDTPERLTEYQKRYGAEPQWNFYTGTLDDSIKIQKAFDSYFGDKMNHRPVFFMREAPGQPWVRLEGFTSPDDLISEYRALSMEGHHRAN